MRTMKLLFVSALFFLVFATLVAQPKPWVVPANFKAMKNPIAQSDASAKVGIALFKKNCASCHGKTGLGDCVKVRSLKDSPGVFSTADFQSPSAGDIFYLPKTRRGR